MNTNLSALAPPLLGLSAVYSGNLVGLDLRLIRVEVASRRGPSSFELAGLAEASVREARIRVSSALTQLGLTLDEYSLTVSLAPASVRKGGSALDLALAVCILGATGRIRIPHAETSLFVGELGLDGQVRPIPGVLPMLEGARRQGLKTAYVPLDNEREASRVQGLQVYPVTDLSALVDHLDGAPLINASRPAPYKPASRRRLDVADIRGQAAAKRALLVAAAGGHHLLLVGPPGAGKSLLARRLPSLLPPLSLQKALETTAIHSVAGLVDPAVGIVDSPPFRAPHHTVSEAGLIGGGGHPRPGEISLAHHGILFLDELPEFRRPALEALRQPLEEHRVQVSRARAHVEFPARPLLVAAMNPCPCGHFGSPLVACRCSPTERQRYLRKLSGPLLDRIDLHVNVPPAEVQGWTQHSSTEPPSNQVDSQALRALVHSARARQQARFDSGQSQKSTNSMLELSDLDRVARPDATGRRLLESAAKTLGLSARGYVRVLRIARTLADLDNANEVASAHVGEAIRYRTFDPECSTS